MSYLDNIEEHIDYIHDREWTKVEAKKILKKVYEQDPMLMFLFNLCCYKIADRLPSLTVASLTWYLDKSIYDNKNNILKNPLLLLKILKKDLEDCLKNANQSLRMPLARAIHSMLRLNKEELDRFGSWLVNTVKYLPELISLPYKDCPETSWLLMQTWHTLDEEARKTIINNFINEYNDTRSNDAYYADYILSFVENCKLTLTDYYNLFNSRSIGDHLVHYLQYPTGRKSYWRKVFDTLNENKALLITILCLTYQNVIYRPDDIFNIVNDYLKSYNIIPDNIISLKLMKQKDVIDSLYDSIMKNKILKENDDETDSSDIGNSLLLLK